MNQTNAVDAATLSPMNYFKYTKTFGAPEHSQHVFRTSGGSSIAQAAEKAHSGLRMHDAEITKLKRTARCAPDICEEKFLQIFLVKDGVC